MRAIKLITVSTVAVLMGGASLAIGQEGAGTLQGGSSILEDTAPNPGNARGSEIEGSSPRAVEMPMRRSEASGERGSNIQRSHGLQRSQAMTAERGRAISRERGQAMAAERGRAITGARAQATTAEHRRAIAGERGRAIGGARGLALTAERGRATTGQGTKAAEQIQGQLGSRPSQSFGQAAPRLHNARAGERNAGAGLNAEQRTRLREILSARRDIPRVSNLSDIRVNAVIPRSVRLAAIPEEVVRIYPRLRGRQAFIYRNEMVVVDPLTSRVVARLPA
jgi:hypothetical protein